MSHSPLSQRIREASRLSGAKQDIHVNGNEQAYRAAVQTWGYSLPDQPIEYVAGFDLFPGCEPRVISSMEDITRILESYYTHEKGSQGGCPVCEALTGNRGTKRSKLKTEEHEQLTHVRFLCNDANQDQIDHGVTTSLLWQLALITKQPIVSLIDPHNGPVREALKARYRGKGRRSSSASFDTKDLDSEKAYRLTIEARKHNAELDGSLSTYEVVSAWAKGRDRWHAAFRLPYALIDRLWLGVATVRIWDHQPQTAHMSERFVIPRPAANGRWLPKYYHMQKNDPTYGRPKYYTPAGAANDLFEIPISVDDERGETEGLIKRWRLITGNADDPIPGAQPQLDDPDEVEDYENRIYIVEGEKSALAVAAAGLGHVFAATGGSNGWRSYFNWRIAAVVEHLLQCGTGQPEIIILPDNDDAGRQYAETIRDSFAETHRKLLGTTTIAVWDEDLPDKFDPYDAVLGERGGQDGIRLIRSAIARGRGKLVSPYDPTQGGSARRSGIANHNPAIALSVRMPTITTPEDFRAPSGPKSLSGIIEHYEGTHDRQDPRLLVLKVGTGLGKTHGMVAHIERVIRQRLEERWPRFAPKFRALGWQGETVFDWANSWRSFFDGLEGEEKSKAQNLHRRLLRGKTLFLGSRKDSWSTLTALLNKISEQHGWSLRDLWYYIPARNDKADDDSPFCERNAEAEMVAQKGYSPSKALCPHCRHKDSCAWWDSREEWHNYLVLFGRHQHLNQEDLIKSAELIIVDEDATGLYRDPVVIDRRELEKVFDQQAAHIKGHLHNWADFLAVAVGDTRQNTTDAQQRLHDFQRYLTEMLNKRKQARRIRGALPLNPTEPLRNGKSATELLRSLVDALAALPEELERYLLTAGFHLNTRVGGEGLLVTLDYMLREKFDVLGGLQTIQQEIPLDLIDHMLTLSPIDLIDKPEAAISKWPLGLVRALLEEARMVDFSNITRVRRTQSSFLSAVQVVGKAYHLFPLQTAKVQSGTKVIVLDATSDLDSLSRMWGNRDIEVVELAAYSNKVKTVSIGIDITRRSLGIEYGQGPATMPPKIADYLHRLLNNHQGEEALIGTFKPFVSVVEEWLRAEGYENVRVAHYGGVEGSNDFENATVGILLGTPRVNGDAQAAEFNAVLSGEESFVNQEAVTEGLIYGARVRVPILGTPDSEIQYDFVMSSYYEEWAQERHYLSIRRNLEQMAGRLRAHTQNDEKTIYLLCAPFVPFITDVISEKAFESGLLGEVDTLGRMFKIFGLQPYKAVDRQEIQRELGITKAEAEGLRPMYAAEAARRLAEQARSGIATGKFGYNHDSLVAAFPVALTDNTVPLLQKQLLNDFPEVVSWWLDGQKEGRGLKITIGSLMEANIVKGRNLAADAARAYKEWAKGIY